METVLGSSVLLTPRVEGSRKASDWMVTGPALYSYQRGELNPQAVSGWRTPGRAGGVQGQGRRAGIRSACQWKVECQTKEHIFQEKPRKTQR